MPEESRHNSMAESTPAPDVGGAETRASIAGTGPLDGGVQALPDGDGLRGRREFLGKSGKLLIYVPPVIQLFIPTKALAASPSS